MKISIDLTGATEDQVARFQAPTIDHTMRALCDATGDFDLDVHIVGGPYQTAWRIVAVRANTSHLVSLYGPEDATTLLAGSNVIRAVRSASPLTTESPARES